MPGGDGTDCGFAVVVQGSVGLSRAVDALEWGAGGSHFPRAGWAAVVFDPAVFGALAAVGELFFAEVGIVSVALVLVAFGGRVWMRYEWRRQNLLQMAIPCRPGKLIVHVLLNMTIMEAWALAVRFSGRRIYTGLVQVRFPGSWRSFKQPFQCIQRLGLARFSWGCR